MFNNIPKRYYITALGVDLRFRYLTLQHIYIMYPSGILRELLRWFDSAYFKALLPGLGQKLAAAATNIQ